MSSSNLKQTLTHPLLWIGLAFFLMISVLVSAYVVMFSQPQKIYDPEVPTKNI